MIDNQLGRRNLAPDKASYLRGKKYNRVKQQGARNDLTSDQNEQKLGTDEQLADEYGVGSATIRRDGKYAESLDTLADTLGDAYRDDILNQNIKATRKDVQKLADIAREAPEKAQAIVESMKQGKGCYRN